MAEKVSLIGMTLGNIRIERQLGRGGMGEVYLGHHLGLNKKVAVKVLASHLVGERDLLQRFVREARAAARLEHPGIVQVHDITKKGNLVFLVMQYVEGPSLAGVLRQRGSLEPAEVVSVARQVGDALAVAHDAGVVHRDIKPDNILIDAGGRARVADFGLARQEGMEKTLSQPGQVLGTPYYMAPEQAEGKRVDARADQYALGATLYHAATGRRPFEADSAVSVLLKHVKEPLTDPTKHRKDLPAALVTAICRMMAKSPDDRYPSLREAVTDLAALPEAPIGAPHSVTSAGATQVASPAPTASGSSPTAATMIRGTPVPAAVSGRRKWIWIGAAGAALLLVVVGIVCHRRGAPRRALQRVRAYEVARPDDLTGIYRQYVEVARRFPGAPQSAEAMEAAEEVVDEMEAQADALIDACYEGAVTAYGEGGVEAARALLDEAARAYPDADMTESIGDTLKEVTEAGEEVRLSARVDQFWNAVGEDRLMELMPLIDPRRVEEEGREKILGGLRLLVGVGRLARVELINYEYQISLDMESGEAEVEMEIELGVPRKPSKIQHVIQKWVLRDGEWFLKE